MGCRIRCWHNSLVHNQATLGQLKRVVQWYL